MPELGPPVGDPLDFDDVFSDIVKRSKRNITKAIIHCSDSNWGDFPDIDAWHKERKDKNGNLWKGITFAGKQIYCGYHYLILNGKRNSDSVYDPKVDGIIEKGRPDDFVGSHCEGMNQHSLGVCLIGKTDFTKKQKKALYKLLWRFIDMYNLSVYGHYKFSTKTCPNFDVEEFMKTVYGATMD
jgi:hypothetical protein